MGENGTILLNIYINLDVHQAETRADAVLALLN